MNFLPDDYEAPKSSSYYFRMQEGENRIRILTRPIIGWEDWQDKKPLRYAYNNKPAKSVDPKKPVKHFWAFVVFNINEEQIQIFRVPQSTIRKSIEALCKDKDWGAPYLYDIKINKIGEGVDAEYTVNPVPHTPVDPYIIECFNERRCNLDALLVNGDPFSPEWPKYTPLAFDGNEPTKPPQETLITEQQAVQLQELYEEATDKYQTELRSTLRGLPKPVNEFSELPSNLFERIKLALIKNKDEAKTFANASNLPF